MVLFVLHGTLSNYVAANGPTNGGVKIRSGARSERRAILPPCRRAAWPKGSVRQPWGDGLESP